MASTAKSAVSDYEHLKYRFGDENQVLLNESEDDDSLPLKARGKQINQYEVSHLNSNQNSRFSSSSKAIIGNQIDSISKVPVPSAWSPGMIVQPNPSLFVTPEKPKKSSSTDLGPDRDNILEPRDLNKIPAPMAWSPHPEPKMSVFITPEKHSDDATSFLKGTSTSGTQKPAIQTADTTKSKEKLSVRFDLPSSSSGDEFMDSSVISNSYSPITIKSKDVLVGEVERSNFSCPSKVYNPMIYSDDSVLDDSFPVGKGIEENDAVSLSTSANLVDKLNELLASSKDFKEKKSLTHSSSHTKLSQEASSCKSSSLTKGVVSSEQSSLKKVASSSHTNAKKPSLSVPDSKASKKYSHRAKETESGPHHLSSSVSPYYPPNSGACVVREAKHPMVSTDYSYPFQNVDDNQEYEHTLSRPEFNSTLKVRSELDSLCDLEVDVERAVEVKLSKSNTKRTEIQEKAAVYTNQLSDQFSNLVDLEPAVDRLCDRVVRMRTSKAATQRKGNKNQKKISSQKEPDLMEFYSGDLQKESPDLHLLGINPTAPDLMGAPHGQAFDCYRHNRVWNGLKDF